MSPLVPTEPPLTAPPLKDACYLDSSAAPPAPHSLITAYTHKLTSATTIYGNPHSHSPSSVHTARAISAARAQVLERLFHVPQKSGQQADEGWDLVFTSGATASLKLVADSFEWRGAAYRYADEAHTSLVAVRDVALSRGAAEAASFPVTALEPGLSADVSTTWGRTLIGVPAQCNATGRQYPLDALARLKARRRGAGADTTYVLLDAAAYLSAHQTLDLSRLAYENAPDYIAFSFYKVFGFPTGLGGLVVKRAARAQLEGKVYYGGGTVDAITPTTVWRVPQSDFVARMEDGTVNFHAILGIGCGFDVFERLFGTEEERRRHVHRLTRRLARRLAGLRHGNGEPVCRFYSRSTDMQNWTAASRKGEDDDEEEEAEEAGDQGAALAFNLLASTGTLVPPTEIDRLACIANIHLRAGRHCNAGVVTSHIIGATERELVAQYHRGVGCDEAAEGAAVTASVRVSLGVANTRDDVDRFVGFVARFFVQKDMAAVPRDVKSERHADSYTLRELIVYPIKSCAGQQIRPGQRWPLTAQGLKHDREWVLVDPRTGKALSQKKHHRMALIRSGINLDTQMMDISFGGTQFAISISARTATELGRGNIAICGDTADPIIHHDPLLNQTLSDFLGLPCALARQPVSTRHSKLSGSGMHQSATDRIPLLLSNESPFLLINDDSVDAVTTWMMGKSSRGAKSTSFRGNFTIGSSATSGPPRRPFVEDDVDQLTIGPHVFSALGQCRRCQMVAIDQETGEHAPETFVALAKHRRNGRGRIMFGMHLTWRKDLQVEGAGEEESLVEVGMPVRLHYT